MSNVDVVSRRRFAKLAGSATATLFVGGPTIADAFQAQNGAAGRGAAPQPPSIPRPDALKSELLMDLILETAPGLTVGTRRVVPVVGGTFEGPRMKGKVISPGADWPVTVDDNFRVLDVRTVLVTDDNQQIYCTYRGHIFTPPAGQGERYWRTTPIFETGSEKYAWLNHVVAVGVNYTVPQRVAYRIFQIL